ncbi:glutamate-5-semialdehyde dehydrogenase [candidate division KSB1 bacterium]|nr:glutamate-5-semialdehyde dehydrogenase [candidate division KSB1 bacterium]
MLAQEILDKGAKARRAADALALFSTTAKNQALAAMAEALLAKQEEILAANAKDIVNGKQAGLGEALLDRLLLNEKRIASMAHGLGQILALPDPLGDILKGWMRPNGLQITQKRVPLGVIGIIYEARPNVTVDAAGLCLKAGNAVILRGGKEAIYSNLKLAEILALACEKTGLPEHSIQLIESTDRQVAHDMMQAHGLIDVLIPRGGASLIQSVVKNASVPVIETGVGNCHLFVDASADHEMAIQIAINAKTQRPGVCNAIETLLVHASHTHELLPKLLRQLAAAQVEIHGCEETCKIFPEAIPAKEDDWRTEYLALKLAVRIVPSLDAAIAHIRDYSSKHSEAIVTQNYANAERFVNALDAAALFINASTRFTDGFEFGFGAEIGISTQKLHARGPMGLEALTTYKYIVRGEGQVRV